MASNIVYYHFELQMAGVILLTAMLVCGITLWVRRRRAEREATPDRPDFECGFDSQDSQDVAPDDGKQNV